MPASRDRRWQWIRRCCACQSASSTSTTSWPICNRPSARKVTMTTIEVDTPTKAGRWTAQWKELYSEVVTAGLCTGCSGCVVACPHDVLGYNDDEGVYKPFHLEEELGPTNCGHGERGCTSCTRA